MAKGGLLSVSKEDTFIKLMKKREDVGTEAVAPDAPKYSAPSFYVNDIELPIDDKDLKEVLNAEIKIKPTRISKSETNGKASVSYNFEILGIKFTK
jgi:hypothetical protein